MPRQMTNTITGMEEIAEGIFRMKISSDHICANVKPGQFVNIKCCDGVDALLRRPISICSVDRSDNTYDIVFQKKGTGTAILAGKKAGECIDVLGPLGNGFDTGTKYRRIAVVGGGIGVFPLLFLLEDSKAIVRRSYLGFRTSKLVVLEEEFRQRSSSLCIATDDGSYGSAGFVTDMLRRDLSVEKFDMIYACGPEPMLRKVSQLAGEFGTECQISMEQRMGCGFGTCLACACKTKNGEDGWHYSRVCRDGPVFSGRDIVFE
jgi:dihydroorotate dehydrogenase electron transfer subunit